MKDEKVILNNTAYQVVGKVLTSSLGFVITYLLTRYLGVTGFGQYSFVLAFVGFAFVFADFGLNPILVRREAEKKMTNSDFSTLLTIRTVLLGIVLSAVSVVAVYLPYSTLVTQGIIIVGLGHAMLMLSMIVTSIFRGRLEYGKVVFVQVLTSVIHFILMLIGVMLALPPLSFFVILVIGYAVGLVVSIYMSSYTVRLHIDWDRIRMYVKEALPFALGIFVSMAAIRIDTLMLGYFYSPDTLPDVGYYALGLRIYDVIVIIGGFYTGTLLPYFSKRKLTTSSPMYIRSLGTTLMISAVSIIGMFTLAQPVIDILGGGQFGPSIMIVQVLKYSAAIALVLGFFNSYLIARGYEKIWLYVTSISLVLNVILNWMFIPSYSYLGASWTTVATQALNLILTVGFIYLFVSDSHVRKERTI